MWQIPMGVEITTKKKKKIRFGFSIPAGGMGGWSVSNLPPGKDSLAPCPIPVLLHVQLVAQQEHRAAALAAPRVQGQDLQVALAALKALPIVDAVDDKEGAGPAQVTLAVPGAILGARGVAELWSSRRPARSCRAFGISWCLTWSAVSITFSRTGCWSTSSSEA